MDPDGSDWDNYVATMNQMGYEELTPILESSWKALPTFTPVLKATTVEIGDNYVKYLDENGKEQRVAADDVVLCGGVHALTEEAVSFSDCAAQFFVIGDARCPGNVHHCTREAYAAADRIV